MKNMKKIFALVLALIMIVSVIGCKKNDAKDTGSQTSTSTTAKSDATDLLGQLDTAKAEAKEETPAPTEETKTAEAEVKDEVVAGPATYTLNSAATVFPTLWNPHTYETSTDSDLLEFLVAGFYTFDYNDTIDGYKVVPAMATSEPIDVTADYIGRFGLTEESKSQAYIIPLRQDIKWEDGTPINAYDFVESAKRLENPDAQNYRADNFYSGNMVIHNAQNYLYAGKNVKLENATNAAYALADLTKNADGVYCTPAGGKVYLAVNYALSEWLSGNTLKDYVDAYGDGYFDVTNWDAIVALADEDGLIPLTDENYALYAPVTTGNPNWGETEADLPNYFVYEEQYPELSWDEVGLFAKSDYELVIVLDKPLKGFYLLYSLTDSWLVKNDLYDSCISYVDGVYTNTYGTSADTIMSYGPYKLTSFQADKQYTYEKNPYYFGYNDKSPLGETYQTTNIVVDFVPEATTRLELFCQGKLDSYGLQKDDMETYSRSDYCYYTPGDSTYFMAFNPNLDALVSMQAAAGENINKTILTIPEFRMAMSFAMNRSDFCLATSPTNNAAFALYSTLIISDPENGTAYRTTPQAKQVIANFWGVANEFGEGKLYADIDEAIDSVTGYNLTKAQEYFNLAYDKAIELGYMDADDVVEIKVGTPNNTSAFYNNGYEYIVNNYTEAVKGTKLEGKLTFSRDDTLGNGFSSALKNNQVDMLFGVGWTGSTLDPYGLMEAYTTENYQYDPAWNTAVAKATINVKGVDYTASILDWTSIMAGDKKTVTLADGTTLEYSCGEADEDPETRLSILAAIENAVLMQYDMIPLMDASTAGMRGQQIKYFTEDYIFGMGRGGIKYYTFNYTDAEWDAYVASCGGTLDYK